MNPRRYNRLQEFRFFFPPFQNCHLVFYNFMCECVCVYVRISVCFVYISVFIGYLKVLSYPFFVVYEEKEIIVSLNNKYVVFFLVYRRG